MEIPKVLFSSPFFTPSRENLSSYEYDREYSKFLKRKDLNPIQKMNYLTLGGFLASILGVALTIFSEKAGRTFGTLLTLLGLGGISGGIYGAKDSSEESSQYTKTEEANTISDTADEGKKVKKKKEKSDLSALSDKGLIKILKTGETVEELSPTIMELGKRKVQNAVDFLIGFLDKTTKGLREAAAKALGEFKSEKVGNALTNLLKNEKNKDVISAITKSLKQIYPLEE